MERKNIEGFEGLNLACYLYEPKGEKKACVLIIHGMQEHALRYKHFAQFLAERGYVVLSSDLRAHGHTAKSREELGHSNGDIFRETLNDQSILLSWLDQHYDLPIYVFAHSYGSMIAQGLMQRTNIASKYVLCGTANGDSCLFNLANLVTGFLTLFGRDRSARSVESLSFKAYEKKFERGNWFTRDESVFDEYLADAYCGGSFPYSFYHSLFKNMHKMNRGIKLVSDKTKVLFIAGTRDPIGEYGKQVKKLYEKFKKKNKDAYIKLYADCRHELINELNKDEIMRDVVEFYQKD